MLQYNKWQVGTIIVLVLMGAYFALPNFFDAENPPPGFADTRVTLGLDLQGGSYLLLEVDTPKVLEDRVRTFQSDIRSTLRQGGRIPFGRIEVTDRTLRVPINNPSDMDTAFARLRDLSRPLGGPLGAAAGRDWRVTREEQSVLFVMTEEAEKFYADSAVIDSIEVVRRRIDSLGTTEPSIQRQGPNRIVVQVPGNSDSAGIRSVIDRTGALSFHMVDDTADPLAPAPPRRLRLPMTEFEGDLIIFEDADDTGEMVTAAGSSPN